MRPRGKTGPWTHLLTIGDSRYTSAPAPAAPAQRSTRGNLRAVAETSGRVLCEALRNLHPDRPVCFVINLRSVREGVVRVRQAGL